MLQLTLVYHPVMHRLFGTAPMGLGEWAAVAAASLVIFLLVETEKWLRRRRPPISDVTRAARAVHVARESASRIANSASMP